VKLEQKVNQGQLEQLGSLVKQEQLGKQGQLV
jgi:hypothetical protein